MGTNSILSNLNYEDMISTIKLKMGADIKKEITFLIVEGREDVVLLKHFCKTNVFICESYSGKKGVHEILRFFKGSKNVVAVRDRDYERRRADKRIFYYDFCNMEMMLINDEEVFEKLIEEHYAGVKDSLDIRHEILNDLLLLSHIRMINEHGKNMWNFNGIDYKLILDDKSNSKQESILCNLKRINPLVDTKDFIKEIKLKDVYTYSELIELTNGHDFLRLLSEYCKDSSRKNVSQNILSENLRVAFVNSKFRKTRLYKFLKSYQIKNDVCIV